MKKYLRILSASVAAFALLFSCTKQEERPADPVEDPSENPGVISVGDGMYSLTVIATETKTTLGAYDEGTSSYPKKWVAGDVISVNGTESLPLEAGDGAGTSTATFRFSSDISAAAYQVVYPASAYNPSTGKVTIPAGQTFTSGSFDSAADIILGYGTNPASITVANAVAYVKIQLTKGSHGNFGVKNVKISAAGKKLNGAFEIAPGGLSLTVPASTDVPAEQVVTLDASAMNPLLSASPTTFFIAVAPQELAGGFTVTATDTKDNTMDKVRASAITLNAGRVRAMDAYPFEEYVSIKTPADLLAFASACSSGSDNYYDIEANIDMNGQVWPEAGTADAVGTAFNGVLDGGNNGTENGGFKISNLTSTTGAFINCVYNGTVKNVTLDSSCSIGYSTAITANCYVGSIVGIGRGIISYCFNRAPVSCSSPSYSKPIYVGGIAGRLYRKGSIEHCYNYASVTCSAANGTSEVCMGGIVGSLERNSAGDNATISNCQNEGKVDRGTLSADAIESPERIGGVIGRLMVKAGSDKISISNLVHSTNTVNINYETRKDDISILVGGLIGGVYGSSVSNASADVDITNSHVLNCTVNNGYFNNTIDYGTAPIVGGLIGLCRGVIDGSQNICIKENCYVSNVAVTARRGMFGGLVGWMRGTEVNDCDVLASSVKSSAQGYIAGGVVACAYDSVISGCNATLTKNATSSLYTKGSYLYTGGVVGWARGATTIENCRVFVTNMYQATVTAGVRGWIAGYCNGTATTINKCGLGGTYGNSTPSITVDDGNFADYIYGSNSTNVTVGTGTNACYYWDGTI